MTRPRAELWSALALWAASSLLPGLAGALRPSQESPYVGRALLVHFLSLLGPASLRFLPKCPLPLFLSALPLVVTGPGVVLLIVFGIREERPALLAMKSALLWLLLNAVCYLAVASALMFHGGDSRLVWSWAIGLGRTCFLAGLPALGLVTLVARAVHVRLQRLVVGILIVLGAGFWGYLARAGGSTWAPGTIEDALLSPVNWWVPALKAATWCVVCVGLASLGPMVLRKSVRARGAVQPV